MPFLPNTEGIAPVRHNTEKLKVADRHPATVASERVLRLLYNTVSRYDHDYPGMLSESARQAVLALHAALTRHNLAEQSARLEIAADELRRCRIEVRLHVKIVRALANVERFLLFAAIEEQL